MDNAQLVDRLCDIISRQSAIIRDQAAELAQTGAADAIDAEYREAMGEVEL